MIKKQNNNMKAISILILTLITPVIYSQYTEYAKGKVFDDKNRNGLFDGNEKGIAHVLVSNQKDVVVTDVNGDYTIPVDDQTVIFITRPGDYDVPLNSDNIPQFWYIHQPSGSPDLEHDGIKSTGELPEFINFPLYKTFQKDTFKILVFADVQVSDRKDMEYFRQDVITDVLNKNKDIDLGISLGDLVHDDLSLFPEYRRSMSLLGIPHYSVQGNHDVNYDTGENFSSDTYKSHFGPNYYSFDMGNVHFICLENIGRFCSKKDNAEWWNCYRGEIGEEQLTWLQNDLEHTPQNKLIVICQHIPFQESGKITDGRETVINQTGIFELLKQRENLLVLAGHRHTLQHCYFNKNNGWNGEKELHQIVCSSVCGTWWSGPKDENGIPITDQTDGVPNGYFIMEFQGNHYIHTFYPSGSNSNQVRIVSPKGIVEGKEVTGIIVNVFNSNKYSKVTAIIDNGEPIMLVNEIMCDPYIEKQFQQYKEMYKRWASPAASTQMWTGNLPGTIEKGLHIMEISVTDEYQRIYNTCSVFEIR